MAKLNFDFEFIEARDRADSDPEAAKEALLIVVERLRKSSDVSPEIVGFLSDAIEQSMSLRKSLRGPALLKALKLQIGHRPRSKTSWLYVGRAYQQSLDAKATHEQTKHDMKLRFGISESTAYKQWKTWCESEAQIAEINRQIDQEDHESTMLNSCHPLRHDT
jgi:hypothetical protein